MAAPSNCNGNKNTILQQQQPVAVEGLQIRTLDDPRIVERIRVLDKHCFPVKYSNTFYDTYLRPCAHQYNLVAFYYDILVGSCACRFEATENEDEYYLYVMTLSVLAPYRRLGIGSQLLGAILNNAAKDTKLRIRGVTLHVQVGSEAMEFYKRFGFEVAERIENYYCDLEERDAFLLRKMVQQENKNMSSNQQRAKNGGVKGSKKK